MESLPIESEISRSAWAEFVLALLALETSEEPETPENLKRARGIVDRAAQLEKSAWSD